MSKLRKAAQGQECQIQLHPYCNGDPATTVLAHMNCEDKGTGYKSPDFWASFSCSSCHSIVDGDTKGILIEPIEIERAFVRGVYRTIRELIKMGLIKV